MTNLTMLTSSLDLNIHCPCSEDLCYYQDLCIISAIHDIQDIQHLLYQLRQLLTNAFDDLIDDDEFSVTSDEGGDSRNSSLHFRSRGNSNRATPVLNEQKHDGGLGSSVDDWARNTFPGATSTPMIPQHGQLMTAPYGDLNSLRRSQELQQALQEYQYAASEGFHSGDFLSSSDHDGNTGQGQSYQPYMHSVGNQNGPPQDFNQNPGYHDMPYMDEHGNYHSPRYMELPVRQAAEGGNSEPEISAEQHQYHPHYQQPLQQHGGYYSDPYEQEDEPRTDNFVPYSASSLPYSQGYHSTPSDMGYYTTTSTAIGTSVQNALDTPVSRGQGQEPQIRGQGQLPVQQQNYDSYKVHYRKNKDMEMTGQEKIPEDSATSQDEPVGPSVERENLVRLSHDQDKIPKQLKDRTNPLRSSVDSLKLLPDREHPLRGSLDSIKKRTERERDHPLRHSSEEFILRKTSETPSRQLPEMPIKQLNEKQDKEFLLQEGNSENKQMAQLQILYKARGRKLEEMTNDFDAMKQELEREIRILKHQVSLAKAEKEGASTSLKQCQDLLQESKGENAQVIGKLRATEAQVEAVERGKEEVMKKLQTAESTIETLNHQLQELGNSETLSRARHEHDVVVAGLQQKYEKEIKVLNEKIDMLNEKIQDKESENKTLKQKLTDSYKSAEDAQISRADTINKLTRSLEESQKQCQALLESSSSHELSQLRIQLQQATASKKIADDMCQVYQEELKDLKEQLEMMESATSLGLFSQPPSSHGYDTQNDSMADLGIRKTLDFETPESGSRTSKMTSASSSSSDELITSLKAELERCLVSNKQKREQVSQLQNEIRSSKRELEGIKERFERSEKSSQDCKKRLNEWEDLMRSSDKMNAVENRLRKDVENLKQEKQILLEDTEELKKRLEEVAASEEKLSEINRELNEQISQMVKDHDKDKTEALERTQKACESVHQTAKEQLRQELQSEFDKEKSNLITKYETDCTNLRNELNTTLKELDEVKDLYVNVCNEKDKLEDKLKVEMENKLAARLDSLKHELEKEKETEVNRLNEERKESEEKLKVTLREQIKQEYEESNKKLVETKVAMAKVEWFEEQRSAKQAAIDNALKLAEAEWKLKLEESIDTEVDKRITEAKSEWVEERRTSLGTEVQQQINKEKENWEKLAESNFEQRLKREKELWEKNSELEMKRAVDKERVKVITRAELDLEVALQREREKWKKQMNTEIKERLDKEKKEWEDNAEVDMLQKIHTEKEKWNKQRDHEIQERLEEMKLQLTKEAENKFMEKLEGEKAKIEEHFIDKVKNRVSTEKEIWKNEMEAKHEQEVQKAVERAQKGWEEMNDQNIEKIKSSMEETVQERIQAEVSLALDEAKKQWTKDHDDQMNTSLSATEAAKSVLQEEIDKLESEKCQLQSDLRQKEESWMREKEEIIRQKDTERKGAVAEVQDQCEKDYDQFTKDHHATLTQALKSARDQHNKEKAELSNRHTEELQKYKDKEKQLLQQLQDSVKSPKTVNIQEVLEKERKVWEEENLKLRGDVEKRDQLLEKADTHLSEEIEKLRSELETAYQKRLESEVTSSKQKFELEVNRSQTFDQKEKGKMQNQIQELKDKNEKVKGEFEKVKGQMQGEIDTYKKDVLELKENLFIQIEKSSMAEAMEKEIKSSRHTCELLQGENEALLHEKMKLKKHFDKLQSEFLSARTEIENYKQNNEKIVKEVEIERSEKSQLEKGFKKLEMEMEAIKTERDVAVENIKNLENAYKKDIATHKQKQEEMNSKLQMAEKVYNDKKQQFMSEVDSIKQCLTTESNVALETMKNKMVDMQKSHMTAMESLKDQYHSEVEELQQKLKSETEKSLSSIEVQTDSEDDHSVLEMRDQYLETVSKIKEDVLRHITETNLRAAETVKCEIGKQRRTTLQQLKKIYMDNVRKVLQNEIIGANIESKLQDIEQALEALSGDEQDGRPVTPGSESSRANTPTPSVKSNYSQRSVGSHSSLKNQMNSNKSDYEKDYDGERWNSFNTSNFSDYDGHYKQEEVISPREKYSSREVIHKRHPGKSHQKERLHRNVTTRSGSPNRDYPASSESSDQEFSSQGHYEKSHHRNYQVPKTVSFQTSNEFYAVDPRLSPRFPVQRIGSPSINMQNNLYKAISEPELNSEQLQETPSYKDFMVGTYKYTSLRDRLASPTVPTSPTKVTSISSEDLRSNSSSDFGDIRAYSVDVGLNGVGFEKSSPRKYNPSPEKLRSHDAGESPVSTPKAVRKFDHGASRGDVLKSGMRRETRLRQYGLSGHPVKQMLHKFQQLTSDKIPSN